MSFNQNKRTSPIHVGSPSKVAGLRKSSIVEVSDYIVSATLGSGSFGKVKLGVHKATKQEVALKFLERDKIVSDRDLATIEREIQIQRKLSHPNVVRVLDVVESSDFICMITEYVQGGDLLDYIMARGRLEEDAARAIFLQLVDTLAYCHANLVIHRDLKPDNILITENGQIKINDFGLSNVMKPGSLLTTFCGSPMYASPEIMRKKSYIGPEVDFWSLGVILYTMVSGLFPWDGESVAEQMRNAIDAKYEVPDHASKECIHLLSRLLEPDSAKRATLSEVYAHPWLCLRTDQYLVAPSEVQSLHLEVIQRLMDLGFRDDELSQISAPPLSLGSRGSSQSLLPPSASSELSSSSTTTSTTSSSNSISLTNSSSGNTRSQVRVAYDLITCYLHRANAERKTKLTPLSHSRSSSQESLTGSSNSLPFVSNLRPKAHTTNSLFQGSSSNSPAVPILAESRKPPQDDSALPSSPSKSGGGFWKQFFRSTDKSPPSPYNQSPNTSSTNLTQQQQQQQQQPTHTTSQPMSIPSTSSSNSSSYSTSPPKDIVVASPKLSSSSKIRKFFAKQ